jgi:1,4-alpha-glucan branching enzyme
MQQLPADAGKRVRFELPAEPGSRVFVAGTFNDWSPTANPLKDNPGSGHCKATLSIPPGRHEYKFVVNGEWRVDPNCTAWAPNELGSLNSVILV